MKPNLRTVKGKIYGDNADDLLEVADLLRNAFGRDIITSVLRDSEKGGFHIMLTVYLREAT